MKVDVRNDGSVRLDFDASEKKLLGFVRDSMCISAAEIIGQSLDETFRLIELTYTATAGLSKAIKLRDSIDNGDI